MSIASTVTTEGKVATKVKKKRKTAGSHKAHCTAYGLSMRRERNKARKLKKHLKMHPLCVDAIEALRGLGRKMPSVVKDFDFPAAVLRAVEGQNFKAGQKAGRALSVSLRAAARRNAATLAQEAS